MKQRFVLVLMALMAVSVLIVGCSNESEKTEEKKYNYISAEALKGDIESNKEMVLLDIQVEADFQAHHIKGAIPTYAYPAETDEQKAKIGAVVPSLKENQKPIVIICPGGGKGATRTYDYLLSQGIDENRLLILEKGQQGWTFDELLN